MFLQIKQYSQTKMRILLAYSLTQYKNSLFTELSKTKTSVSNGVWN